MKTKKLILMFALLMSGIIVSAQSFTDNGGKMQITNEQASQPYVQLAEDPNTPPDFYTSFGTWWELLKAMPFPGIGIDINDDSGTNNKDLKPQNENRRTLPRLPGPYRYRSTDTGGRMAGR